MYLPTPMRKLTSVLIAALSLSLAPAAVGDRVDDASLALEAMTGPFSSIDALCAAQPDNCIRAPRVLLKRRSVAAPFLEARLVAIGDRQHQQIELALRTAQGWFVDPLGGILYADPPRDRAFAGPVWVEMQEGVVAVRFGQAMFGRDFREGELIKHYSCEEHVVLCGIGASGRPSCTAPIWTADLGECDCADDDQGGDYALRRFDWRLDIRWSAGQVRAAPQGRGRPQRGRVVPSWRNPPAAGVRHPWTIATPWVGVRSVVFP